MSAAEEVLRNLERRWRWRLLWASVLRGTAVALPFVTVALAVGLRGKAMEPVFVLALGLAVFGLAAGVGIGWWSRPGSRLLPELIRHLERTVPEVKNSAELLLCPAAELGLIARLQRAKVTAALELVAEPGLPKSPLRRAGRWLAVSLLAAVLLPWWVVAASAGGGGSGLPMLAPVADSAADAGGPRIEGVRVTVEPPDYTGRGRRETAGLDLQAEEGATVRWAVTAGGQVERATLVFDESERLALERGSGGVFLADRIADESHLYRLELLAADGERVVSAYARFEVVVDRGPEIEISSPAPFVELAADGWRQLEVVVEISDDYAVGRAALVATLASGFGELVEFREQRLAFDSRRQQAPGQVVLRSRLDLEALGMRPGSELFFFVEAADRRRPEPNSSRSATHIVRLPGGGPQSSGLSARLPVLRVPEFFRSQRQIILDAERLLADESTVTRRQFDRRSQALGFDQRALRMRYGGLLGEEFESGQPATSAEEERHEESRRLDEMAPGSDDHTALDTALSALPDGLAHQHDSAEIATYFDSEIKALLKTALGEMWGSEGRLRGLEPRRGLPYAYRALRALKQVQQRSRLYVRKIGFEPPQLYPDEKRLSGETGKIRTVRRAAADRGSPPAPELKLALAALGEPQAATVDRLLPAVRACARRVAVAARSDLELDLAGLEGLREWISALESGELELAARWQPAVRAALWRQLSEPAAVPERAAGGLSELTIAYRRQLLVERDR